MRTEVNESVEAFRDRAKTWIHANLQPSSGYTLSLRDRSDEEELAGVARDREVQRMLFDAGLAGVAIPREYGGQGLTPAHQRVLNEEMSGFEYPSRLQVPTMTPCAAVLLEFGTEEQKLKHIPAILKGEEIWMQFLSEPSGGSDVAAALTSAAKDGEDWILNGSKIWTTGAWWSDMGLVLARTNWDVPKHRGLTVFIMPINQPGVEVSRIEMLNGNREFCQEYMSDVRIPDSDRVGEVDDGWTVGTRWMYHERLQQSSPLVTGPAGAGHGGGFRSLLSVARDAGRADDAVARDLVGESLMLGMALQSLGKRVGEGMMSGAFNDQASAIARLLGCTVGVRLASIAFELADGLGAAWTEDDGRAADCGSDFLMRQASAIGGGTTEMARNVVAERVLGMPREQTHDRNLAFRDVPRGASR